MVRASWVLKRQLMAAWAVLRSVTRAWTSRPRASSSGSRCLSQERDSTLNSISAIFNQLPCLGVIVELQPFGNPPGLRSRERLVQRLHAVSVQVVHDDSGPPRPPDRPRPPAIASVGQSPPSCAVGSPPRAASRPAARRPGTGCGRPPSGTCSPAAAEFRAGAAEMAASGPTTGWRSRQSRPPAFAGHRVPRIGPALPPCAPRTPRSPWGCTTLSSATA